MKEVKEAKTSRVKAKVKQDVQTVRTMAKNAEEMLDAVAISTAVIFSGYQAYMHRSQSVLWSLLGLAAAYAVFQAFRAWGKVLNKKG